MVKVSEELLLEYNEYRDHLDHFRKKAVTELINNYNINKSRCNEPFKWGDEMEYTIVKFDHENKKVYLLLKAKEFFENLEKVDKSEVTFGEEYTNYQIETTPNAPWEDDLKAFENMQKNLTKRRELIGNFLDKDKNEHVMSFSTFPRLGCSNFTWPITNVKKSDQPIDKFASLFFSDDIIYPHDFMQKYTMNKNQRTTVKPTIYVPIFPDTNTPQPFIEDLSQHDSLNNQEINKFSRPNQIYMDHDGFGFGCTCLQVTMQLKCMNEAAFVYDQLSALSPIFLAMSASSPIWRGYLSSHDTRWPSLQQSNDDRSKEEIKTLPKTRFDCTECYISAEGQKFNVTSMPRNEKIYNELIEKNIDPGVANSYANMFLRDPYFLFKSHLFGEQDFPNNFDYFQSLNFKMARFKPPPCKNETNIGWRVEFRPLEIQFTDYENTAFSTLIILLARTIAKYKLNFLIHFDELEKNMKKSEAVNSCMNEKFYFRFNDKEQATPSQLLTINEITNGNTKFAGILKFIEDFLDSEFKSDENGRQKCKEYLELFKARANGSKLTPATWMRNFVRNHSAYKFDSIVNEEINYDLMWEIFQISNGKECKELF